MAVLNPAEPNRLTRTAPALAWTSRPAAWAWAATAVLLASMAAAVASPVLHHIAVPPEDDAEYYRVIARHIAAAGFSSFDGQVATNGYHPLWTWLLALQFRLVGDSFLVTRLIEVALVTAAFPLFLVRSGLKAPLSIAVLLALYGRLVAGLALTGMEVSLLVGCTGLLVWLLRPKAETLAGGVALGLALAAAVLARIDAAVFVLPLAAFAPLKRSTRAIAFAAAGAVGAAYVAYNLVTFGAALPLSSAVKSLGGLQLNRRFLEELVQDWKGGHLTGARYVQTFGLLALSPLFLAASRKDSLGRALAAATLLGGLAYTAKIAFDSSWRIWPWYNFPVLFGLLSAAFTLGPRLEAWAGRRRTPALALAAAGLAALALLGLAGKGALVLVRPPAPQADRFDIVNAEAARRFAPVLRGARVAMGDRAGAFAAAYPGGVTQLEGLVNDRAWYAALKAKADLKPLLCGRGVRFVAAYARDLGAYDATTVPAMRPRLTQFDGPVLTMRRADEVGRFADRAVFDMRGVEDEDDVFYLWRLPCP